ncbi:hypothetical protein Vretimale_13535 [Volvox reticuliferus]|uniref:Uncharacterized protein n=1 Tax=Volvox reticuliferus TaxID=1737510 RepID=A0A8J4GLS4_9CHLO|nr:hypothetical protein Vretifemale_364 [Volvox reticuliferus]GIM09717.1 hypothetical protein Vretimale_13535 [Volvox reticuliferus]
MGSAGEVPRRFEQAILEVPDLTAEQRRLARILFLKCEPVERNYFMKLDDKELKLLVKVLLDREWDMWYQLTRFCWELFFGRNDSCNRPEGPSNSSEDFRLLGESENANVRQRCVQTTAAPCERSGGLCRRHLQPLRS